MFKLLGAAVSGIALVVSAMAFAGERTVTLAVQNMYCAACPHTVKSSLEQVPGVAKVVVSFADKTAVVTFDDAKTGVIARSKIACPRCGRRRLETMPVDACLYFYKCTGCGVMLRPKPGDCCVFCSYGSVPCPPVQQASACRA